MRIRYKVPLYDRRPVAGALRLHNNNIRLAGVMANFTYASVSEQSFWNVPLLHKFDRALKQALVLMFGRNVFPDNWSYIRLGIDVIGIRISELISLWTNYWVNDSFYLPCSCSKNLTLSITRIVLNKKLTYYCHISPVAFNSLLHPYCTNKID